MIGLCDKARMIRNVWSETKIAGRTELSQIPGAWFKARLTVNAQGEAADTGGQRVRVTRTATLIYGPRDLEGQLVLMTADDRVEVNAVSMGQAVWALTSHPEALRRRGGRVVAFQVEVQRVEDEKADDRLAP